MPQTTSNTEHTANWTNELSIPGRAASNLEDEYATVDDVIEAYRAAEDIIDIPQVGDATMRELRTFIHERDENAKRTRDENDEAVCTEYVDHPEMHGKDSFYFSFVCPRCDSENPLTGDPNDFKNRPFACNNCRWVSLLEANALNRFVENLDN